ncbi:MAG: hypothetical protein ACKVQA_06970 [Burkholderiales bacterium]
MAPAQRASAQGLPGLQTQGLGKEVEAMKVDYTTAVANYFKARPGQDVSNWELMEVGGSMAYRTRISNCRKLLRMDISTAHVVRDQRGVATSYYVYTPPVEAKTYTNLLQIAEASQ